MTVVGLPAMPAHACDNATPAKDRAPTNATDTQPESSLVAMRPDARQTNTVMRQHGCARGCEEQPSAPEPPRRPSTKPTEVKSAPAAALTANPRRAPLKKKKLCRLTPEFSGAGAAKLGRSASDGPASAGMGG